MENKNRELNLMSGREMQNVRSEERVKNLKCLQGKCSLPSVIGTPDSVLAVEPAVRLDSCFVKSSMSSLI
jgi:hypothetical protein